MAINETATGPNSIAVTATASGEETVGVLGKGDTQGVRGEGGAVGVRGIGNTWHGVAGLSKSTIGGFGVYGHHAAGGTGVAGESKKWVGVYGKSESTTGGAGVLGEGDPAPGVIGKSTKWIGVYGETAGITNGPAGVWGEHKGAGTGVKAVSKDGVGLAAYSTSHEAIHAETKSPGTAAIAAYNANPNGTGAAIFAKKEGTKGHAGFFAGNVEITGNLMVQGVAIQALLDRIKQLEQKVADLSTRVGSGRPIVAPGTPAVIIATVELRTTGRFLRITGNGFQAGEKVRLAVNYFPDANANAQVATFEPPADSLGFLDYGYAVSCPGNGTHPRWDVKATGLSSGRVSNPTSAGC
ncbi:MAG: hypothetical protein ND895_07375 [Pyrinomonadaceae bacterium]|nr:hypothetical protein [Pyrinomonadaceae bacterium]